MKSKITPVLAAALGIVHLAGTTHAQQQEEGEGYIVVVPAVAEGLGAWREVGRSLAAYRETEQVFAMKPGEEGMAAVLEAIRAVRPRYVAFVVPPEWVEDSFVGRVFEGLTRLDDDPLLDCAHGFITGRTAADAMRMVERTIAAEGEREDVPRKFVGVAHRFAAADLGPFATQQSALHEAYGYETAAIIGVDDSEEWEALKHEAVKRLNGSSLVYVAGHGMGDWMCAIDGELLRGLTLESAIVVNGTCHSAATIIRHDIDPKTMKLVTTKLDPEESIALNFIAAGAIAQYGSTAMSAWMNVGMAIDGFFHQGQSMGEALRDRLNAHLVQEGIEEVNVIPFEEGKPSPQFFHDPVTNPGQVQSIARVVLLGDPAYTPFPEGRPPLAPEEQARLARDVARAAQERAPHEPPHQPDQPNQPPPPAGEAQTVAEMIAALDDAAAPPFQALNRLVWRGEEAVEPLIEAMKSSANWQIPKALGAIGDERAIDPLIEKLGTQPGSPMREVVVEALERISGEELGDDVKAWRKWRGKK